MVLRMGVDLQKEGEMPFCRWLCERNLLHSYDMDFKCLQMISVAQGGSTHFLDILAFDAPTVFNHVSVD